MKLERSPHSWRISPTEAVAVQRRLADRLVAQYKRERRSPVSRR